MSARVSVRIAEGDDAAVIAVKSATTLGEIEALAAEADRLSQIAHPGVVSYVGHWQDGDRAELHTFYAGESLERWHGTIEQVAGLAAALATTLAELHDAGVVHGRLDRSHVLRGTGGRPVLCGLSPPPEDAEPANDVAALGQVLEDLLTGTAARHPPGGLWRRFARPGASQRALARVASRATDPMAARRPAARALAQAILDAVPGAQLPDAPARPPDRPDLFERAFVSQHDTGEEEIFVDRPWQSTGPRPRLQRLSRARVPIAALGLAGLTALAAGYLLPMGGTSPRQTQEDPARTRPAGEGTPECATRPEDHGADNRADWVDVNGDRCPEPVVVTPDGVVEIGRERWAVGEPGDAIALGDWDCDGSATPAVYRRATGDVFVFDTWADRGRPLTVEPVAQVSGGVSFVDLGPDRTGGDAAACDIPVIELSSGAKHAVEVTP